MCQNSPIIAQGFDKLETTSNIYLAEMWQTSKVVYQSFIVYTTNDDKKYRTQTYNVSGYCLAEVTKQ